MNAKVLMAVRSLDLWTFAVVAGAAELLCGLWISGLGVLDTCRAIERDAWPEVPGTILQVDVRTDRVANGQPADSRVATYAFMLNDRPVFAEQSLAIPVLPLTRAMRENALKSLRKGPCRVHYNPRNPSESWILAEPPLWEQVFIGLAMALMGGMIWTYGWFHRRGAMVGQSEPRGIESLPRDPPGPRRWDVGVPGLC